MADRLLHNKSKYHIAEECATPAINAGKATEDADAVSLLG
jgi:hypothetical protein